MLSELRQKLIKQLSDGQFHSGTDLAESLGLSRAAIHNHIKAIEALGLAIYRVKGKGYRLVQPLNLLDGAQLRPEPHPAPLHLFWLIDSTNTFLLSRSRECQNGEACLAEMQSQGRGRRGRTWVSPFGSHLYLSYFWRFEQGFAAAAGLSLAIGVLLAEALADLGVAGVSLKWPNDLYLDGRKLAGILVEASGQQGEACEVVIGCGINVRMPQQAAAQIDQAWADLSANALLDRNRIAAQVLARLDRGLVEFETQGLAPFVQRWQKRDHFIDQPVVLLLGERELKGIARGIDEQGHLLLALPDGSLKRFAGGELSLRAQAEN